MGIGGTGVGGCGETGGTGEGVELGNGMGIRRDSEQLQGRWREQEVGRSDGRADQRISDRSARVEKSMRSA